ncbi:MAG: aldehyde dehydrogenase family protein [Humibacillus sp.]|nr:aldehyde dehydrogenase family protein [Humibacillus sp.]MDN5777426.1 aldehyde dehydrogenase family protein [Humibacillus sp.]
MYDDESGSAFFRSHQELLEAARAAIRSRQSWSGYEGRVPSQDDHGASARFAAQLGSPFELVDHPGVMTLQTDEVSPYTREALGISYPRATVDELVAAARSAQARWSQVGLEARAGLCLEMLERVFRRIRESALYAMHTTGQGLGMSVAGSGTNALDRGLEALALAYDQLARVPNEARWARHYGTVEVRLTKSYRTVSRGPAAVVACASFPAWNVYPAVFANVMTGNPVIIKPHPSSVLQMAFAVKLFRSVLTEVGLDANLVTLCTDDLAAPVTQDLVTHPGVRIVDFTGSAVFGSWIEQNVRQAIVFTETSGANPVVLHSVTDADAPIKAIAGAVSLFSAQMCAAPQNIYVPAGGIRTDDGVLPVAEFCERLVSALQQVSTVPRRAAAVLGAVQCDRTLTELATLADAVRGRGTVLLESAPYAHPEFEQARTAGPLVALVNLDDRDLYEVERFGPIVFVIVSPDAETALARAAGDAASLGAITSFVYATDEPFIARAEDAFAEAGAALSINVTGPMPASFSAAFSDYHVTGLNPAGTATLSDDSFITGRYAVVQSRRPDTTPTSRPTSTEPALEAQETHA